LDYAVETFNLTKVFKGGKRAGSNPLVALDHVNLKVEKGAFFGLLGPNGAGKTTLIKILCTIVLPTEGTAKVNGYDILKEPDKVRESFGWLHGETGGRTLYWRLSAEDNLKFYAYLQNVPKHIAEKRISALLEFFDLEKDKDKLVKEFSTGMKVRVMLARSLLANPPIFFMDEPTVGLDTIAAVETRALLKAMNRELGKTIIFTSHNMYEVEKLCERVAIIRKGRIVVDATPSQLSAMIKGSRPIELKIRGVYDPVRIAERLEELPLVRSIVNVKREGSDAELLLWAVDEYEAIPQIVNSLKELGVKITSIRQVEPNLEEVFVEIAKGEGDWK